MRKRLADLEDQNVDRWLVSYADFITILFAFFVVMYSISQVNEGKYRILSESLSAVFVRPERSLDPIQIGDVNRDMAELSGDQLSKPGENPDIDKVEEEVPDNYATFEAFRELEEGLNSSLKPLIDQNLVNVKSNRDWLEINLQSALLFQSGSDELNRNAGPVLEEVASHLENNLHKISVRGHSDNIPIETEYFDSNWSLSAARAVSVVRYLQSNNIDPRRLSAEGLGEFQPIADNLTVEGRAKNRRVVIAVSRYTIEDEGSAVNGDAVDEITVDDKTVQPGTEEKTAEPEFELIRLPNGGLLIRGKDLPENEKEKTKKENKENEE